jgi:hypothetical protein
VHALANTAAKVAAKTALTVERFIWSPPGGPSPIHGRRLPAAKVAIALLRCGVAHQAQQGSTSPD